MYIYGSKRTNVWIARLFGEPGSKARTWNEIKWNRCPGTGKSVGYMPLSQKKKIIKINQIL